jgi:hypothetical protein
MVYCNTRGCATHPICPQGARLTPSPSHSPNISYWSPASIYLEYVSLMSSRGHGPAANQIPSPQQNATTAWYLSGNNVTLQGTGGIDGSGQTWWDAYAVL